MLLKVVVPREEIFRRRFFSKVRISADSACHEWSATKNPAGYGIFGVWENGKTQACIASRVAYQLAYGPFDSALEVRHKCDNPGCVNPEHLELGTHQQNMNDMLQRNRARFGTSNNRSGSNHLSARKARTIRKLWESGEWTQASLARRYSVSGATIHMCVYGKRWKQA